jgi:hypothetical protein
MQDHQGCEVEKIDKVADKQIGMMEVRGTGAFEELMRIFI